MPGAAALSVSATWPVRSGRVPPLAERFSARPETAPDLEAALAAAATVVLTPSRRPAPGLDWLGCSGKTQLVAHYAESLWRARAIDLLAWIDASSAASILAGYVATACALSGTQLSGDAGAVTASLLGWLAQTEHRWLVVLDDLADAGLLDGLHPRGPAGRVLITSASPPAALRLPDALVLQIGRFSPREAMEFLVDRLSSDVDQRRGAIGLIEDLGCHPQALAHAAGTIASSWMTCVNYLDQFRKRQALLTGPAGEPPPAAVTWTLAVDHANQLAPGGIAQSCLALAAMLDGHGIPAALFGTAAAAGYLGTGRDDPRAGRPDLSSLALASLEQVGLLTIDRSAEPATVMLNGVLQEAVRAAMPASMVEQAASTAADALLEMWPDDDQAAGIGAMLRANTASLQHCAGDLLWREGLHPVLLRAGQSLDAACLFQPAVTYWHELSVIADRVFGPAHPEFAVIAERLAAAYLAAGQVGEAMAWFRRLANGAGSLGPDHPRMLAIRVELGKLLVTVGQPEAAVEVLASALNDTERVYGYGQPEALAVRTELATAFGATGRLSDAIGLYRQILAECDHRKGPPTAVSITTRQRLAEAYQATGQVRDAVGQYRRLADDLLRSRGAEDPDTLAAQAALASASHQVGPMAQIAERASARMRGAVTRTPRPSR